MIELGVNSLSKRFSTKPVLIDVSFTIKTSQKIGIVGSNGCGKTTIFKIITGIESPDSGDISIRKGSSIGYLQQEPGTYSQKTSTDVILCAFDELLRVKDKLTDLEHKLGSLKGIELEKATELYGRMQHDFESRGGYDIDVELAKVCSGLQISNAIRNQYFEKLSGGEKTRVMLARILLEKPDILLLDEPTNHLDIGASEWLEDYLNDYEGAVLIISHDRYFLDRTVSKIIEIEGGRTLEYTGNYSAYIKEREQRLLAEFEEYKNIQKKIKAMKAAAERFRIWGRINPDNSAHFARAKKLEQKIEELQHLEKPRDKFQIKMQFASSSRSGNDVIKAENLCKSFADRDLFKNVDFLLRNKERLALIGTNGSGKTTFFKMISGIVKPDSGYVKPGGNVRTGVMEQEIEFEDQSKSVIDIFRTAFPMYESEARNILARFLFRGDDVFKKISALSGGEKVRLKICFLMQQDLNLLMLDEPTNHLDIESKEMIEDALLKFKGTIFFISHDRYFINKISTSIVALEKLNLKRYYGNYDYYKDKSKTPVLENITVNKKTTVKTRKTNPQIIAKLEEDISNIEAKIAEIEKQMETHSTDYSKLMELQVLHDNDTKLLNKFIDQWENLQV